MAYRYGNREQMDLFPPSIEDYVSKDNPVRAYDAFVEALDFNELGITLDEHKVGNPEYDPKSMVKLLIFGPSYGFRGSRKLERATHDNFSFIWLMKGLKPDHKTIAEFRRKNTKALKNVLKQCARLCIKLGLIAGNNLFVDGTKIRANASIKNAWTEEKCEKHLRDIDKRIEAILSDCEEIDNKEQDQPSLVKLEQELKDKETLKSRVENILKELTESGKKSINTVDPECTRLNSVQGSHAGYNTQVVVDEKHGLIVNTDVVGKNTDTEQFAEQINQANSTLEKKCAAACADSGYAETNDLEKINKEKIKVIVPSQRQAAKKELKKFDKQKFNYDSKEDSYICPEGRQLTYSRITKSRPNQQKEYRIKESSICKQCRHFGVCTTSPKGRTIARLLNEELREKFEAQYEEPESQAIYKLRKQKVELPFGHIKRNLKVSAFLLRGRNGVKAEMSLLGSCFNITRMMSILGVQGLIQELARYQEGIFYLFWKHHLCNEKSS